MKKLFIIIATALCLASCSKENASSECIFAWEQDPVVFCNRNGAEFKAVGQPEITIMQYGSDYSFIGKIYADNTLYRFQPSRGTKYIMVVYYIDLESYTGRVLKSGGFVNKVWDISDGNRQIRVTKDDKVYIGDASRLLKSYFKN